MFNNTTTCYFFSKRKTNRSHRRKWLLALRAGHVTFNRNVKVRFIERSTTAAHLHTECEVKHVANIQNGKCFNIGVNYTRRWRHMCEYPVTATSSSFLGAQRAKCHTSCPPEPVKQTAMFSWNSTFWNKNFVEKTTSFQVIGFMWQKSYKKIRKQSKVNLGLRCLVHRSQWNKLRCFHEIWFFETRTLLKKTHNFKSLVLCGKISYKK